MQPTPKAQFTDLEWDVIRKQAAWQMSTESEIYMPVSGQDFFIRTDNNKVLSQTSKGDSFQFTSISEMKKVIEMISALDGFEFKGWNVFKEGAKVFAYFKTDRNLLAGWKADNYLVLSNGFDGSTSLHFKTVNYIYRCENMFGTGINNAIVKNTKNHAIKRDDLIKEIEIYLNKTNKLYNDMQEATTIELPRKQLLELASNIIFDNKELSDNKRTLDKLTRLTESMNHELDVLGNNLFGMFNGITHFTTHNMNAETSNRKINNVFGNIEGISSKINTRAVQFVQQQVELQTA